MFYLLTAHLYMHFVSIKIWVEQFQGLFFRETTVKPLLKTWSWLIRSLFLEKLRISRKKQINQRTDTRIILFQHDYRFLSFFFKWSLIEAQDLAYGKFWFSLFRTIKMRRHLDFPMKTAMYICCLFLFSKNTCQTGVQKYAHFLRSRTVLRKDKNKEYKLLIYIFTVSIFTWS